MEDIQYRSIVWLTYRLAAIFGFGLPLVLLIWSSIKKEHAIFRLMSIYWKIASLMGISIMLLTDQRAIGYLTSFISPLLMIVSIWFWVDINDEIADLPSSRPLIFTVKIWRWALTSFSILATIVSFISLQCIKTAKSVVCVSWLEAPNGLHQINEKVFGFLFGADWTEALVAFIGYIALLLYIVGIIQWLLIQLPKQGRVAGGF